VGDIRNDRGEFNSMSGERYFHKGDAVEERARMKTRER